jgi:hemolysin activation/secretion protein
MLGRSRNAVMVLGLLALAALLPSARAQQPQAVVETRFTIERFVIEGNTLLPQQRVESLVEPFRGKEKDFSDIQRALEALEGAYRDAGWGLVQVVLPEQDITKGTVRFRIVEARLSKVVVEGNKAFSTANVLRSVPALKVGTTPNSRETAKNLQVAAENPAKQTTALLRSGEGEGEVIAVVQVTEEKPWKLSATVDNTGSEQTGKYRLGFGFLHANMFDRDHMLTAQFITSPNYWDEVKIFGMGYRIPLYTLGASIDIVAGYAVTRYAQVEVGYGHFFAADYIEQSLSSPLFGSQDANFVYAQVNLNF